MKKTAQTTFIRKIGRGLALVLPFLVVAYGVRFYQVEAAREYSQAGIVQVMLDTIPEVREKKIDLWTNGIGCHYPLRLRYCLGIELSNSATAIPHLAQRFKDIVDNFCLIVEKNYPEGVYEGKTRPQVLEFSMGLNHAYFTYFDCRNSRKPIGEVRLYISNESKLSGDARKAKIITKL